MRRAINNISTRLGHHLAIEICNTLRRLQSSFQRIYVPPSKPTSRGFAADLTSKIEVMKQSVCKVENACYNVHVRGSEKPDGWTMDLREDKHNKRTERDGSDDDETGGGKRRRTRED